MTDQSLRDHEVKALKNRNIKRKNWKNAGYIFIFENSMMNEDEKIIAKKVQQELARLCVLRISLETRQQVLLSKSIYLSRFVKIASLDNIRNAPEMALAKKYIFGLIPGQQESQENPFEFKDVAGNFPFTFSKSLN